jgi:hypothetical protein
MNLSTGRGALQCARPLCSTLQTSDALSASNRLGMTAFERYADVSSVRQGRQILTLNGL